MDCQEEVPGPRDMQAFQCITSSSVLHNVRFLLPAQQRAPGVLPRPLWVKVRRLHRMLFLDNLVGLEQITTSFYNINLNINALPFFEFPD